MILLFEKKKKKERRKESTPIGVSIDVPYGRLGAGLRRGGMKLRVAPWREGIWITASLLRALLLGLFDFVL